MYCIDGRRFRLGQNNSLQKYLRKLGGANEFGNFSHLYHGEYVLIYSYDSGVIHHLDLYRLEDQKELEDFDYEDLIAVDGFTLVEWPKLLRPLIDTQKVLNININYVSDGSRELILSSHDYLYERLMN